jgi:hypothetical protein
MGVPILHFIDLLRLSESNRSFPLHQFPSARFQNHGPTSIDLFLRVVGPSDLDRGFHRSFRSRGNWSAIRHRFARCLGYARGQINAGVVVSNGRQRQMMSAKECWAASGMTPSNGTPRTIVRSCHAGRRSLPSLLGGLPSQESTKCLPEPDPRPLDPKAPDGQFGGPSYGVLTRRRG